MSTGDCIFKLLVGGEGGVGKTTILNRYLHGEFVNDMKMTVGAQFHVARFERGSVNVKIAFWDLGGQEQFRFILPSYCLGAHGAFVLFDMSRYGTLEATREWFTLFKKNAPPGIPMMLVGTKYDTIMNDAEQAASMDALGNQFAREFGCIGYASTSSRIGLNVAESIHFMVDHLIQLIGK
jgi:small GTP-binding protein